MKKERRTLTQVEIEQNVYEKSIERINHLYDRFDTVVVSFSGGKDSTVCLNLALEVARKRNRLPLEVYFFDEEVMHPETIQYVERIAKNPDIKMKWLCIPVRHRNACSRKEPYWYPWNEADRYRWARPLPENAITTLPGFKFGMAMPEITHFIYSASEHGTVAEIRGIRAQESLRRRQSVTRSETDNWLTNPIDGYYTKTSPIYDWTTIDVWTATKLFGWDYNRTYDVMEQHGLSHHQQRVGPPYGEEPLQNFHIYKECWPEHWDKMLMRVHGAATAHRYNRSQLYAYGKVVLPEGKTWRTWMYDTLEMWAPRERAEILASVNSCIGMHTTKSKDPIPEEEPHAISGISWKFLCFLVIRGDMKGRKKGMMLQEAHKTLRKLGITFEQALEAAQDEDERY